MAVGYDPRIIGAHRMAHPADEFRRMMAHRTSDLIRGLDPETVPPVRCGICSYSAHTREYLRDHYLIVHRVATAP